MLYFQGSPGKRKEKQTTTGLEKKLLLTTNGTVLPSAQLSRSLRYIHVLLINYRVFNNDTDL